MQEKFRILSSKGFITGLALLLLNDFVLKTTFHNWFTGKLSDVAGLFIFPLFWLAFFPKHKKIIFFLSGLFFIYWKSPFSQEVIDLWNSLNLLSIGRIVDYSDLIALFSLPLSFYYSGIQNKKPALSLHPFFLIFIASFSFVATSRHRPTSYVTPPFYTDPVKFGKEINVERKAYTFTMPAGEMVSLLDKYHIRYLDEISSDSALFIYAFKGYDSLPPLVKITNQYVSGKTIMQVRSVIFNPENLADSTNKKQEYYKTENAALFAKHFETWFVPEFKAIKASDSLNTLGSLLWKTYPDSAISIYSAAIKIAPQWVNAKLMLNYGLGNGYFYRQQYDQALKYYYKADSINNRYSHYNLRAPLYSGLEAAYEKLGRKDSAKKYKKLANIYAR